MPEGNICLQGYRTGPERFARGAARRFAAPSRMGRDALPALSVTEQRERPGLQVKPETPFGVAGVEAVALDAVLPEGPEAFLPLLESTTLDGRTPFAIRSSASKVVGHRRRVGQAHEPKTSSLRTGSGRKSSSCL